MNVEIIKNVLESERYTHPKNIDEMTFDDFLKSEYEGELDFRKRGPYVKGNLIKAINTIFDDFWNGYLNPEEIYVGEYVFEFLLLSEHVKQCIKTSNSDPEFEYNKIPIYKLDFLEKNSYLYYKDGKYYSGRIIY